MIYISIISGVNNGGAPQRRDSVFCILAVFFKSHRENGLGFSVELFWLLPRVVEPNYKPQIVCHSA